MACGGGFTVRFAEIDNGRNRNTKSLQRLEAWRRRPGQRTLVNTNDGAANAASSDVLIETFFVSSSRRQDLLEISG
jgi:hypothetical protein